jgi:hypothetical protein
MKTKTFLLMWLFIGTGMTQLSAQEEGVIFDTFIVTLRPGVTMDQYLDFLKTRYVSEYNKNFPGSKLTIGSPDSWRKKNQYSFFYTFESNKEYNKYYTNGLERSDICKAAWQKMESVNQEVNKYISDSKRVETEWEKWMDELIVK